MQLHKNEQFDYTITGGTAFTATVQNFENASAVVTVIKKAAGLFTILAGTAPFSQSIASAVITFTDGVSTVTVAVDVIPDSATAVVPTVSAVSTQP